MMVSLMVAMLSSTCSASNPFLNASWNSVFFDPTFVASTLGGLLVINSFPFQVKFDVAHNHAVIIYNVDFGNDCYVCDNYGIRYTVWAFSRPSPPCFLLEHGIHELVLS